MGDPDAIRPSRARRLKALRRAFAAGQADGAGRLRDELTALEITAASLGRPRLARKARRLARRLRRRQRLENHRRLLARVRALGFLSPEAAAGLDSGWERSKARGERDASRLSVSRLRRLERRMEGLAPASKAVSRLQDALDRAREGVVLPPAASARDRELARYRRSVRECVALADALAEARPQEEARAGRERAALAALDRWQELRRFRRRLERSRRRAERQGAVTLVSELDGFLAILAPTELGQRRLAIEASGLLSNLLPLPDRAAAGG